MDDIIAPPGWAWNAETSQWVKETTPTKKVISDAAQYVKDRSSEVSTQVAVVSGITVSPLLYQQAGTAIVAGLAGDYVTCALNAAPVIVGIGGILAGIFTKQPKRLTDEEIKAHVADLSRDQLLGMLNSKQPAVALQPAVPLPGQSQ